MANSFDEKRAQFMKSIKANNSGNSQSMANKQKQFSSNNAGSSGNKGDAPDRQRSKSNGRGNER